ncbi:MAG: hypothetical protein ABSG41_07250 [Bryobacteraceae bacterium]|jgi:hypothetical protein
MRTRENSGMKLLLVAGLLTVFVCQSQARKTGAIPANTRIYVDAASGFDTYLSAEIQRRHVPLMITTNKMAADYELEAVSGGLKIPGPDWWNAWTRGYGEPEIRVVDIHTRDVVFTAGLNRNTSLHTWQIAARACVARLQSGVRRAESSFRSSAHPILDF